METPGRITARYKAIGLAEWKSSINHRFNLAEKNVEEELSMENFLSVALPRAG